MVYQPGGQRDSTMKHSTLSRILSQALYGALLVSAGCGVNVSSFDSPVCTSGYTLSVDGLRPAIPVDYLELRSIDTIGSGTSMVLSSTGSKCAAAPVRPTCEATLASTMPKQGFYKQCSDYCAEGALVATRGGEVIVVDSKAALDSLLAPYDTPQEALFAALTTNQYISCTDKSRGAVRAVTDGFEVVTTTGSGCGTSSPVRQHLLHVDSKGNVVEQDSYLLQAGTPGCVVGRRPEGLRRAGAVRRAESCVGRYFAGNARLEAASVTAFRVLHAELLAHGAPSSLLRNAKRSARDEVRHTQVTRRLARRYGAVAKSPSVQPQPIRSLEALAIENATEGCVRETFGALLGRWQALRAADPAVRRAMLRIARDESRHAALSWQVAQWASARLSSDSHRRIEAARHKAIETLRAELSIEPEATLRELAGVPSKRESLHLLAQLEERLWKHSSAAAFALDSSC